MKPITYAEFDPLTRLHFGIFVQRVFAELNPGADYLDNFHIHVINEALEDLRFGRNQRLAVAMPPRSLKSIIISVAWVAWLLGHEPGLRIICVSYGQELADKMASDCRQVMQSSWYQRLFPGTRLMPGRQSLANFETTAGGARFSTSIGGTLTGFGADYIVVDDPMKPSEALSEAERTTTNNWVQHTLSTRLNDKSTGRIVVVMQRLHEDDVIGNLVETSGKTFRLLTFPAIAAQTEVHEFATPFGSQRVVRNEGDALHPAREPLSVLEEQKALLGSRHFSAQYLQTPVPIEGALIKYSWLKYFHPYEITTHDLIVQSWDTASKAGSANDYSVCTTWVVKDERYYLVDLVRVRLEFPALKKRIIEEADRYTANFVLIEDKGSGESLLKELRAISSIRFRAVMPTKSKVARLEGVSAMIEAGRLLLPHSANWLQDYLAELCGFPGTRHDDQVDSTSQALHWIRENLNLGGIYEYYRQEYEAQRARSEDRNVQMRVPDGVNQVYLRDGTCVSVGPDRTIWVTEMDVGPLLMAGFKRLN